MGKQDEIHNAFREAARRKLAAIDDVVVPAHGAITTVFEDGAFVEVTIWISAAERDAYRSDGWPLCPNCGADELCDKESDVPSARAPLSCQACCWTGCVPVRRIMAGERA